TQSDRFCYTKLTGELKSSKNYAGGATAYKLSNNHIIPANNSILSALNTIRVGNNITLKGFLVNVIDNTASYSKTWITSQRRTDIGEGACEIVYVTDVAAMRNPHI
ncbi:MAG: hypothetical protein PHU34_02525, partial [Candidatus Methanoperedens sp.]|nr:hypothetical protein [Candidatus Methanoperedens sp.]